MRASRRVWPVFVAFLVAVILAFVLLAILSAIVHGPDADLAKQAEAPSLGLLLTSASASSMALLLTVLIMSRPLDLTRLRLRPGRETGRHLAAMIGGVLALSQAEDSFTTIAGFGEKGTLLMIRRALAGAGGLELFGAVMIIGLVAGTGEELFFRGYMQTRLAERWRPSTAVLVTSVCFGLLHLDPVHALLAFVIGLYLGTITELAGSALPAVVCHVINNVNATMLTARLGTVKGFWPNVALLVLSSVVCVGCLLWLRRQPALRSACLRPLD